MRKLAAFLAFFVFFITFALSSSDEEYYSYSYARLSYVKGDVYIQRAEDLGYESGVVNLPVVEGDKLGTRDGRAEIHFGRKNYLRMDTHTQIDIAEMPQKGDDQIKLHLLSGNIYLRVNFLGREKDFEIHTPDASYYILEEGLYRFDVREEESELYVFEGSVEAAGEEGSLLVSSEERLIASDGGFISDPVRFYASLDDDFSGWNRSRDALHSRAAAYRYLPVELEEYEVELADSGRWVYERPYGYVWVPYVVHHDWRPYYYGRWVWYPIIGWNWVSYDSWGWCVYHYGRWHWRLGLGWYWIPTRYWGPAWVHWWRGYDYIGWCPLSYYGHPVVIVNNRFYGHYYNKHYPLNSRALTVIHKRQLQARHISRVALNQKSVGKLGKISLSAKQPSLRPSINRSDPQARIAAKVLSRSNIRKVGKSFASGKTVISPSRLKSAEIRSVPRFSKTSSSKAQSGAISRKTGKILSPSRSISQRSLTKTYPSRRGSSRIGTFSSVSSGKVARSLSPSSVRKKVSRSSSSVKSYPSRSSNSTPKFGSSGRSIRKDSKSVSRDRLDSNTKRVSAGSSSRIRQSSVRTYKSRSYTTPKRNISGVKSSSSKYITSRLRKAPSSTRSSSRSITNRSYRSNTSRSYVSPSRGSSRARSFSSKSVSASRSRTSSFKSSSRSFSSSSRVRSSSSSSRVRSSSGRRSVSSRSSSTGKVKKK